MQLISPYRPMLYIFVARCYASAAYAVMRCVCVCVSVTFVHSVKTNKHIFQFFSPSGRYTILVFPYQTTRQYSDGNPPPSPLTGTSNAGGVGRNRDSEPVSGLTACCEPFQRQVQYTCNGPWRVYNTLVAGERPSLLMVGNKDEVYDK